MQNLIPLIRASLADAYPEADELQVVSKALCCELLGFSEYAYYLREPVTLSPAQQQLLDDALHRLSRGEPLQYVLGTAPFGGLQLSVDRSVLIPRPETSGLVRWVTEEAEELFAHTHEPVVVDVGTGSGCIAVALKQALPHAHVFACDVSQAALRTASRNAAETHTEIILAEYDVLAGNTSFPFPSARCMVSNPPYIRQSERAFMESRVTTWEPSLALFVPDDDPLLFYRALARLGQTDALLPGGTIAVEVNSAFAYETSVLFRFHGYTDVRIRNDIFGLARFVRCRKPVEES